MNNWVSRGFFYIGRQYGECYNDKADHEELTWPYVWVDVTVAYCGQCDNDVPYRLEHVELSVSTSLQMLDRTWAGVFFISVLIFVKLYKMRKVRYQCLPNESKTNQGYSQYEQTLGYGTVWF